MLRRGERRSVGEMEGTSIDFSAMPLGRDDLLANSTYGVDQVLIAI